MAFVWFIWLAPVKRVNSQSWWEQHSNQAHWEESQKSVFRIGVTHDVGIEIGEWGDKKWAAWIINYIKPGQEIAECNSSHLGEALADITNHQLKPEAETWLAWWKTNQNKSQVEWIREGFAEKGVILQEPLTTNNMIDLLKLSHLSTNSPIYAGIPSCSRGSLRMNAFRWLRDSGIRHWDVFRIWDSDTSKIPEADKKQIIRALLDYAEWHGHHWSDPNKLIITQSENHGSYSFEPFFLKAKFCWSLYFSMGALALAGIWLIRRQPPK